MSYVDSLLTPVPTTNHETYRQHSKELASLFQENSAPPLSEKLVLPRQLTIEHFDKEFALLSLYVVVAVKAKIVLFPPISPTSCR